MRHLLAIILGAVLTLAVGSSALADPGPTSAFGGSYLMGSADGSLVAFQMPTGWVRWELNGVPIANYGVDDVARAASVGYSDPSVLVPSGAIRGTYVACAADLTWLAFIMPDGSIRWEHDGMPAALALP